MATTRRTEPSRRSFARRSTSTSPFRPRQQFGPPPGSAETAFGQILRTDFLRYRDELIISTKAGYEMWAGPHGEWGGRKYMLASPDQSLKRTGLEYADIFYSHRLDPQNAAGRNHGHARPRGRSGKALDVGVSSYNSRRTREAVACLAQLGTPCMIHQPSYSMLNCWVEEDRLLDTLDGLGVGSIVFSPLAQGMLTDKYLAGIPGGSRASEASAAARLHQ